MGDFVSLFHGFSVILSWYNLGMMVIGLILGIIVGVLPGLGQPGRVEQREVAFLRGHEARRITRLSAPRAGRAVV